MHCNLSIVLNAMAVIICSLTQKFIPVAIIVIRSFLLGMQTLYVWFDYLFIMRLLHF